MKHRITNRLVSAQDIIDAGACYENEEVHALVPEPVPLSSFFSLNIPDADKVWAVLSMTEDKRERVGAASILVREVAHLSDDPRVAECLDICDRYASGEATGTELIKARDAADAAAGAVSASSAAAFAAYAAARAADARAADARAAAAAARAAAARAASSLSAYSLSAASLSASLSAATLSAYSAAFDAAYARQVELLRQMLPEGDTK